MLTCHNFSEQDSRTWFSCSWLAAYFLFLSSDCAGSGCRHGSTGLRNRPPQPTIPLCSPHHYTALLCVIMAHQNLRTPPLSHPILWSACSMLPFQWTGRRPRHQWQDWKSLERTELQRTLKVPLPHISWVRLSQQLDLWAWFFFSVYPPASKCHHAILKILEDV